MLLKLRKRRADAHAAWCYNAKWLSEQVKEVGRLKWLISSSPKITFPLSHPKKWRIIFTTSTFKFKFQLLISSFFPSFTQSHKILNFTYFDSPVFSSPINQTVTSLGRDMGANYREKKRGGGRSSHKPGSRLWLLYLDDKMTASAGTKSLPFTLIISPTSTCENKLITVVHGLWNSVWWSRSTVAF